jgi:hypothetical protein
MSQVIDKLYHIMLYRVHLTISGIRTRCEFESRSWQDVLDLVVIATDCTVVVNPTTIRSRPQQP